MRMTTIARWKIFAAVADSPDFSSLQSVVFSLSARANEEFLMECLFITPIITSPDGDEIIFVAVEGGEREGAAEKCSLWSRKDAKMEKFIFGIVS